VYSDRGLISTEPVVCDRLPPAWVVICSMVEGVRGHVYGEAGAGDAGVLNGIFKGEATLRISRSVLPRGAA